MTIVFSRARQLGSIRVLKLHQVPISTRSGAKECPTAYDSVEQQCTNYSSQVMPFFGTQFRNSYQKLRKCTTSTGVTSVDSPTAAYGQ